MRFFLIVEKNKLARDLYLCWRSFPSYFTGIFHVFWLSFEPDNLWKGCCAFQPLKSSKLVVKEEKKIVWKIRRLRKWKVYNTERGMQFEPRGTGTKNTKWRLYNTEQCSESFLIWPIFERNFNLQMDKVSISSNFRFSCCCCFVFCLWSELVRVDPSWSDPDWRFELIRSDFCTCLISATCLYHGAFWKAHQLFNSSLLPSTWSIFYYNIARALFRSNSYWATMVYISKYARPCVYNMTCAVWF